VPARTCVNNDPHIRIKNLQVLVTPCNRTASLAQPLAHGEKTSGNHRLPSRRQAIRLPARHRNFGLQKGEGQGVSSKVLVANAWLSIETGPTQRDWYDAAFLRIKMLKMLLAVSAWLLPHMQPATAADDVQTLAAPRPAGIAATTLAGPIVGRASIDTDLAAPVSHDFADGLQGGPDLWVVTGLRSGGLRLRRSPSLTADVLASVKNGAVLRNAGCRMTGGARWCKVASRNDASITGWVDGRYLREHAAQDDTRGAGTRFHATGTLPCAQNAGQPTRPCRFGVIREGAGKASVMIFFDGGPRPIHFESGAPSSSDASEQLAFTRHADLFLVSIGAERYEVPEAVITGR
jgi:hypothetical protein